MTNNAATRLVVCAPSASNDALMLPSAHMSEDKVFISGGERSLYELAVAGVLAGYQVELRGDISPAILRTITSAAGVTPLLPGTQRRPATNDLVVIPEVIDPRLLMSLVLSDARIALFLLAPLGLFSWDGTTDWQLHDPMTVPLDQLCQPDGIKAFHSLGCEIWTHTRGIADVVIEAGVPVRWVGTGTPVKVADPLPAPGSRKYDVAVVVDNRWHAWAEEIVKGLPDATVLRIPRREKIYSLAGELVEARILVWPTRVEGISRIAREARLVGTVPVALSTNPFVTSEDWGGGVDLVERREEIVNRIDALLNDPDRLDRLSLAAQRSAQDQVNWPVYIKRVTDAIGASIVQPDRKIRNCFGNIYEDQLNCDRESLADRERVIIEEIELRIAQHESSDLAIKRLSAEIQKFQSRRAVRFADWIGNFRR